MSTFKLCGFDAGLQHPFFLIAGPCVIESEQSAIDIAGELKEMTTALHIPFIYKSSFDKANRSSGTSFRGLGMDRGLEILAKVKREVGVPVLTDIHDISEIEPVSKVVDVIQTPAFLCRQTDFIQSSALGLLLHTNSLLFLTRQKKTASFTTSDLIKLNGL